MKDSGGNMVNAQFLESALIRSPPASRVGVGYFEANPNTTRPKPVPPHLERPVPDVDPIPLPRAAGVGIAREGRGQLLAASGSRGAQVWPRRSRLWSSTA